jgi:hypothetical protein
MPNDANPLRVHLSSCLQEVDGNDQVTRELRHGCLILAPRRPASATAVDPQDDDAISGQGIGDRNE